MIAAKEGERTYNLREAADVLGVPSHRLWWLVQAGVFPGLKLQVPSPDGKRHRLTREELYAMAPVIDLLMLGITPARLKAVAAEKGPPRAALRRYCKHLAAAAGDVAEQLKP